jgi:hypothetical protein
LYELPLEEFTRARNELSARLAKAGQTEAAARVKGLSKPSVPLWAVNQVARREPDKVQKLLELGGELRRAQAGGRGDVRTLSEAERDAVQELVADARNVLEQEQRPASDATMQRIAQTLKAAAADKDMGAQLARGALTEELEPTGFEIFAGLAPARRQTKAQPKPDPKIELRKRLREARAEARDRARAADQAERAAERSRRDAERARAQADEAEQVVRQLEEELG